MSLADRAAATAGLATAAWRTWRAPGLARRAAYELSRRSGRQVRSEARWSAAGPAAVPLLPVGISAPSTVSVPGPEVTEGIEIYGGLRLPVTVPPDWHRHPLTGVAHRPTAHWSTFSDARPEEGDIKDLWELARLGWLQTRLRRWAVSRDVAEAEAIWQVVEDFADLNPPYLGPQWMCGQEASLRTLGVVFLADALRSSSASTPERHLLVARMVRDAVGRVLPTLGYALSQRNNHATSEAGFLWSAALLAPDLPGADRIRRRSARALTEAVRDQFGPDGSYSQHSPSYQRLAVHVLLWTLAVARGTGAEPPPGVEDAVARSVPHLRSLIAPGSGGRAPALGGVDGAQLFALTPCPIDDLRPVVLHAAAATGQPSGLDRGEWAEEAAWFGLHDAPGPPRRGRPSIATHALTRGGAHAVLRAGPLRHRPAHADQLHVDVWLDGVPVARDLGSYRYTAVDPWGNALAGEEVHDVPRRPGEPQAERSGRFFWRRWTEATVEDRAADGTASALLARLDLPGGSLRRLVVVANGLVVVADRSDGPPTVVRWNLPAGAAVERSLGATTVLGASWAAALVHSSTARVREPVDEDPTSGWWAPGYGRREPLTAIEVVVESPTIGITVFAADGRAAGQRVAEVRDLLAGQLDVGAPRMLVGWAATLPETGGPAGSTTLLR